MKNNVVRSPLFYVGDKYKIVDKIKEYLPLDINHFIEPFVGGGSVFMNIQANDYILNDIDTNIINIHKMLCESAKDPEKFFVMVDNVVSKYHLSCSYKNDIVPNNLKREFVKTFYAKFNKVGYETMRTDFNISKNKDVFILYMLLIYGFNRMIRFNKSGNFNLPVGNVDFNQNTVDSLNNYFKIASTRTLTWYNLDFEGFINQIEIENNDFIYLDPPYLITFSEYNKYWNSDSECRLLRLLDNLNERGLRFAISNVINYKGRVNQQFQDWSNRYNIHHIKSNYISYHDNTTKNFTEVLVTNY